jgi:hypothetical protein
VAIILLVLGVAVTALGVRLVWMLLTARRRRGASVPQPTS